MTDISFYADQVRHAAWEVAGMMTSPSVLYRPTLSTEGTKWCALLGADLQVGVAGFGDTPAEAMADFDRAFRNDRTPAAMLKLKDAQ